MLGFKTAVDAAVDAAGDDALPVQPVQLPLIPADDLPGLPSEAAARRLALVEGSRGRGRPAGAPNRSTEQMRRWLLSKYPHPLQVLAETYSRPTADLAHEIGCSRDEAFKLQLLAARELAPYVAGKMPVEVQVSGDLPMLILASPGEALAAFQASQPGGSALDLGQLQIVENQELGEAGAGAVGQSELDSEAKAQADQALASAAPLIKDQPGRVPGAAQGQPASAASAAQGQPPTGIPPNPAGLPIRGDEKSLPEILGTETGANRSAIGPAGEGSGGANGSDLGPAGEGSPT